MHVQALRSFFLLIPVSNEAPGAGMIGQITASQADMITHVMLTDI